MISEVALGQDVRKKFDEVYDSQIVGGGFFESDDYYRREKERYWRSLTLLSSLPLPRPAKLLEIGGGQIAVLRKNLFNDDCVVGDISNKFSAPLQRQGIPVEIVNLLEPEANTAKEGFDAIVLLEVIEHIPRPPYTVFQELQRLLKPGGVLFLTTPNLFRLRNVARMIMATEFLDRFMLPGPAHSLGHQLEYSADHMRWQLEQADMNVVMLVHDQLGRTGHSVKARLARTLLAPLYLRPKWQEGLVAAATRR